jgi:hypothetical protein
MVNTFLLVWALAVHATPGNPIPSAIPAFPVFNKNSLRLVPEFFIRIN